MSLSQGDKDAQVHVREVTMEALQQVMSAGGQQVRVTGQQVCFPPKWGYSLHEEIRSLS